MTVNLLKNSQLEGAESTLILASGMCASTVMMLALVPAGGHIITTTDCYRKTRIFMETFLPKMGITVWFIIHVFFNIATHDFFSCKYVKGFCCFLTQASVIDPADMAGLESALDNHKVSSSAKLNPTLLLLCNLLKGTNICFNVHRLVFFSLSRQPIRFWDVSTLSWFQSCAMLKEHWFALMEHLLHL